MLTLDSRFGLAARRYCAGELAIAGDAATAAPNSASAPGSLHDARPLLADGSSRFETPLRMPRRKIRAVSPDWLRATLRLRSLRRLRSRGRRGARSSYRKTAPDGADLVTVRFFAANPGSLQTYAGQASTGRNISMPPSTAPGPGQSAQSAQQCRRGRRSRSRVAHQRTAAVQRRCTLGGPATTMPARCADIYGPVVADPLVLGFSVGYRFR